MAAAEKQLLIGVADELVGELGSVELIVLAPAQVAGLLQMPGEAVLRRADGLLGAEHGLDRFAGVEIPLVVSRVMHGVVSLLSVRVGSFPLARTWRKAENPP